MSLEQWMPVLTENFHSARNRTQPYKVRFSEAPLCKEEEKRPSQWRPRSLYSQARQPTCTVTQRVTPREWHPFPLFPFASRAEPISIAPLLSADASKSRPNTILVLCMCLYFWRHILWPKVSVTSWSRSCACNCSRVLYIYMYLLRFTPQCHAMFLLF